MHATKFLSGCLHQILAQARNTAIAPSCAVGTRDDARPLWLSTLRAAIAFRLARSEAVCTSLLCYLATYTSAAGGPLVDVPLLHRPSPGNFGERAITDSDIRPHDGKVKHCISA